MQAAIVDAERRLERIDNALAEVNALDDDGYPEWDDRIVDGPVLMKLREHQATTIAAFQTFHSLTVKAKVGEERDTP